MITDMVADQAPRVFAVVLEYGEQTDAKVYAWGMALDDGAYMTANDGRSVYSLADPGNALRYVPRRTNTKPHFVWVGPEPE
ncbi:hypothetical protein ALI144C_38870 [Actinosynnema sp. ALI-1.44]|nr:hypothetical protein ALI144C_38870 [Actinosynnema sp. ALI-1.44]